MMKALTTFIILVCFCILEGWFTSNLIKVVAYNEVILNDN
jgi:hypothetical protein